MHQDSTIRSVLIVGGGTAGWMAAAAFARILAPLGMAVGLVESAEIGTVGVGEATLPHIRHFNARLGIEEAEIMRATEATYKLGIEFCGWRQASDSYIHPFGAFGRPIDGIPFHHCWRRAGGDQDIQQFSLPVAMARTGRFAPPEADPRSIGSTFNYAFQFDASLYAAYLRQWAEARGVVRTEGKIVEALRDEVSGDVTAVRLADERQLDADLFVDCSGFRGLLIEEALATGYEDWSRWLPCDRAVAVPCLADGPPPPMTRATADTAGWRWRIPLQHRVGNGYVYASGAIDGDAAADRLLATIEGDVLAEPRTLRFTAGMRRRAWHHNVVAIGLAGGFVEPLESTSIYLIQAAIMHLIDLWPDGRIEPAAMAEFNRLMDIEYRRTRDFIILHYHATTRAGTPLWDHVRTMTLPDSLAEKIALYRERGIVALYKDGPFLEPSWHAVYLGQGVVPRRWDPRADALPLDRIRQAMAAQARAVALAAATMPPHVDSLANWRTRRSAAA